MDRKGDIPFGGVLRPRQFRRDAAPIRHRPTDVDGGVEYTRGNALFRAGYTASSFHNDVTSLALRESLSPDRHDHRVLDRRIRAAAEQHPHRASTAWSPIGCRAAPGSPATSRPDRSRTLGDPIIPFTINTVLGNPAIALDRSTVNGSARTKNVNLKFTSRPVEDGERQCAVQVLRLRQPHAGVRRERQASPTTPRRSTNAVAVETEPFGVLRHTFDADVKY